jgi:hypothetical protein
VVSSEPGDREAQIQLASTLMLSEDGYFICPRRSTRPLAGQYEFLPGQSAREIEIADFPMWLRSG